VFYSGDGTKGYTHSSLYEPKYMCEWRLIGRMTPDTGVRKRWIHGLMLDKSFVPVNAELQYRLDWLAGILDSDGTVTRDANGNGLQITSIDHEFLRNIRLMLSTMGVRAKVVSGNEEGMRPMPDGKGGSKDYPCQKTMRLLIGNSDTHFLVTELGLRCERLQIHSTPPQRDARQYIRVASIEWLGTEEETYCVTEPYENQMTVNGIVTGNCAEQGLNDYETCCLAEIFLPNIESEDELFDVARLLYRINKHSLAMPCHNKETEEIVHKNMRMGIGVTGYLQATEEQRSWLSECYEKLRWEDNEYSAKMGWPKSIKLTTCKPSGTLSLLPGVTPGVHPAYAQYMIRRIRIASDNALVETCREHGFPVEYQRNFDGSEDHSTVVVEFPFAYPEGTVLAKDLTAIDQLEWVKRLQKEWSDNSVSCTVYYTKDELPKIKDYLLKTYNKGFKTLSFLLRDEHGFIQAPLEAITKEEYERRVAASTPITRLSGTTEFESQEECASGACPIK
jgi:ribonucleotide reductase alpha subunit